MEIEGIDYKKMLLRWAKVELLKEKVKARLDQKYGKELDEIAGMLVDVMVEEGEHREELAKKKEGVHGRLRSFFEGVDVV